MIEILSVLALAGSGIAAGVLLGTVLGGVPLLLSLPADRYVHAHGFLATRYDPFMPFTLVATGVLDLVLAVAAPEAWLNGLYAAAALLIFGVSGVSVAKNVPINKWVTAQDPAAIPADWSDRRAQWSTWNRNRTVLAAAGLLANLVAALGVAA